MLINKKKLQIHKVRVTAVLYPKRHTTRIVVVSTLGLTEVRSRKNQDKVCKQPASCFCNIRVVITVYVWQWAPSPVSRPGRALSVTSAANPAPQSTLTHPIQSQKGHETNISTRYRKQFCYKLQDNNKHSQPSGMIESSVNAKNLNHNWLLCNISRYYRC